MRYMYSSSTSWTAFFISIHCSACSGPCSTVTFENRLFFDLEFPLRLIHWRFFATVEYLVGLTPMMANENSELRRAVVCVRIDSGYHAYIISIPWNANVSMLHDNLSFLDSGRFDMLGITFGHSQSCLSVYAPVLFGAWRIPRRKANKNFDFLKQ